MSVFDVEAARPTLPLRGLLGVAEPILTQADEPWSGIQKSLSESMWRRRGTPLLLLMARGVARYASWRTEVSGSWSCRALGALPSDSATSPRSAHRHITLLRLQRRNSSSSLQTCASFSRRLLTRQFKRGFRTRYESFHRLRIDLCAEASEIENARSGRTRRFAASMHTSAHASDERVPTTRRRRS
jgi:hypothetical protein